MLSNDAKLSEAKRKVLQKALRGDLIVTGGHDQAISPRPPDEPAPLSLAQEQVWLHSQGNGSSSALNESIRLRRNSLELRLLEQSMTEIIRRHEIWRTTYDTLDGSTVPGHSPRLFHFPVTICGS